MKKKLMMTFMAICFLFSGTAFAVSPDTVDSSTPEKNIQKADESLQKIPDASADESKGYSEAEELEKSGKQSVAGKVKAKGQKKGAPCKDKDKDKNKNKNKAVSR